ncbi:MAG: UDP-N-acetylmuramate--L-alanine ligase [Pseudomonadota bacterium]
MHISPESTGVVHFIGIGGIGMSGIAEILHKSGYKVRGSDLHDNANVKRLRAQGVPIFIGQKAEQMADAAVVVVSTAVPANNPELIASRTLNLPVVHRSEMLAEIMRLKPSIAIAGSHGKTTTTSLLAHVMDVAGWDPTVVSGGIINTYGTNARLGSGRWALVEADESDGSFVKLPATISVITGIDLEHMDHYHSADKLYDSFVTFLRNLPFYGLGILCVDHPAVCELSQHVTDRRLVTYGLTIGAEVFAVNVGITSSVSTFDLQLSGRATNLKGVQNQKSDFFAGFTVPLLGEHNIQNALATITVALELGIQPDTIRQSLASFEGVRRRFTQVGEAGGLSVIDDYAHHPVEIACTLKAAQVAATGNVIAVMQPHRYSRLQHLFNDFCCCFSHADHVIVAPVYAAGESPIEGYDHNSLAEGITKTGHKSVRTLDDPTKLAEVVAGLGQSGDYVVCMGAGSVTQWAHALPKELLKDRKIASWQEAI